MRVLTVSEMKAFRRCNRYHHYRYRLGYRPVSDADALYFGRLFHLGLETWWKSDAKLEPALASVQEAVESVGCMVNAVDLEKVRCLLIGYHFRWENEDIGAVAVEHEFETALINPLTGAASRTFTLGGKVDCIAEDLRKDCWVVEHKTTSSDITQGSEYWQRLRLDTQVSTYITALKSVGYDVRGCIYDVVKKPLLRPAAIPVMDDGAKVVLDANGTRVRTKDGKKWRETGDAAAGYALLTRPEEPEEYAARLTEDIAKNPDKYFGRAPVVRLEEDELDAAVDAWQTARQIAESERLKRYPRNPDACMDWGRPCEFFGVCTRMETLDDTRLFRKAERSHEELSADGKEIT